MVDVGPKTKEGLTMGFVKARGSNFYYEEQGGGLPILLIHPSGSTASTWGNLVGDLAGAGRVIAYDRRGYSRSGGEVVRSASEHALDAAAVLEALEAGPAVAVGTSAGATIALELAVRRGLAGERGCGLAGGLAAG
jgi:pimeloyl-ACP methyl ester carboxylesterase